MDSVFFIGLVLGALVGLAVDLWKRPLDRLLDRRLENRTSKRAQDLSARLANNRQGLRDFLMVQILETTLVGSLGAILSGLAFAGVGFAYEMDGGRVAGMVLQAVGQLILIAAAGMVVRIASDAISIAGKIAEFNEPTSVDTLGPEGTSP
jgi:hypothetical protein